MRRVHEHVLDAYGVRVLFGQGDAGWRGLRRRIPVLSAETPESAGLTQFVSYSSESEGVHRTYAVVWGNPSVHHSDADWVDTLAHEAQHAAAMVMEYIGHEPVGIDEPTAYLTGFLARWLFERAERQ